MNHQLSISKEIRKIKLGQGNIIPMLQLLKQEGSPGHNPKLKRSQNCPKFNSLGRGLTKSMPHLTLFTIISHRLDLLQKLFEQWIKEKELLFKLILIKRIKLNRFNRTLQRVEHTHKKLLPPLIQILILMEVNMNILMKQLQGLALIQRLLLIEDRKLERPQQALEEAKDLNHQRQLKKLQMTIP